MSSSYEQKLNELAAEVARLEGASKGIPQGSCASTLLVVAACVPLVVFLILFFFSPSFVKRKEGDQLVRDNSKVFGWTIAGTVFVWAAMYLYAYYNGYNVGGMLCYRK